MRLNRDGPDRSDQSLSAADKLHTHSLHHAHRRQHHHHAHHRRNHHHLCVLGHFIMEGTLHSVYFSQHAFTHKMSKYKYGFDMISIDDKEEN